MHPGVLIHTHKYGHLYIPLLFFSPSFLHLCSVQLEDILNKNLLSLLM